MSETGSEDPWAGIAPGAREHEVNSRRVEATHPLDLFWARDHLGRYGFLFSCHRTVSDRIQKPVLSGIDISFEKDGKVLLLVLKEPKLKDMFRLICTDLMRTTQKISSDNEKAAIAAIMLRLLRWQELLKSGRSGLLSDQEQLGLLGELSFLEFFLLANLPPREAVGAWRGPMADEQDFGFGMWLFEVKTQLSTSDQALQISSLSQLDTTSGMIALCHQTFGICSPNDDGAVSLGGMANSLDVTLSRIDINARDQFRIALLEFGYSDRPEYRERNYRLSQRRFFKVRENFPRLVPNLVPHGITKVRYSIELAACTDFEVRGPELEQEVFGNHG